MTEQEIKAIEHFSNYPTNWNFCFEVDKRAIDTILGLISKLQKELESQKQGNKDLVKEGVKLSAKIVELDKVIDLMAEEITYMDYIGKTPSKKHIKERFYKKVEEENE